MRTPTKPDRVLTDAWRWFALAGAALVGVYFLLPGGNPQTIAYQVVGLSAAGAIVAGTRLHAPARATGWLLLAGGLALWFVGDLTWGINEAVFATEPFPSLADVFYLASYPVLTLGVVVLVRDRLAGRDLPAVLDAFAVTVAVALPSWVFLIGPMASDTSMSSAGRIVAAAYPAADLVVLAVLLRLLLAPGVRGVAFWLLLGGLACTLVADTIYAVPAVAQSYTSGDALDALYLLGYVLLGAAALHPSMASLTTASGPPVGLTPRGRIALVSLAGLSAPALLAVEAADGNVQNVPLILVGWCIILAAVLTRLAGVMRQLEHDAKIDPLTRLPNRALLLERMDIALKRPSAAADGIALLYLDLDGFKEINDSLGHAGGDLLLIEVAERLRAAVRPGDLVARLGGDEFVVLCRDIHDEPGARAVADRLTAGLSAPFWMGESPCFLSASIGISRLTPETGAAVTLLEGADTAMYRAKSAGKARAEIYEPSLDAPHSVLDAVPARRAVDPD